MPNPNPNTENLRPFQKGEDSRRNKNGTHKTKFLTDLLTKNLKEKKDITIDGIDVNTGLQTKIRIAMPTKDVIVQALLRQAAKGNMIAIKEVWDRTEGKAMQAIELSGKDGNSIIVNLNPALDCEPLKEE